MKDILCNPIEGQEKSKAVDLMLSIFQGEDNMKEKFPKAYEAFSSTPATEVKLASKNDLDLCRMRVVHVAYTNKQKNELLARVLIESGKIEGYDMLILTVYDGATKEQIGSEYKVDFIGDDNTIDVIFPLKGSNYKNVIIEAGLNKIGNDIQSYMGALSLGEFEIGVDAEFHIDDPQIKKQKQEEVINISYYPASWYQYDYLYPEARKDGNLYIPNRGSIVIKDINITSIDMNILTVAYRKDIPRRHANRNPQDIVLKDTKTIEWNINANWRLPFNEILKELYSRITYTLLIEGVTDTGMAVTFIVSNAQSKHPSEREFILPPIEIYKDCFVRGTLITLQNGSKSAVENLHKGDVVTCCDGTYSAIAEINGTPLKQPLGYLELENGMNLSMTPGHLVMTNEGLKPFVLLTEEDVIKTEIGMLRISRISNMPEQECEIFVLVLENGRTLAANGIITSDSAARLTEKEKEMNKRCMVPKAWRQDYDSWRELKKQM